MTLQQVKSQIFKSQLKNFDRYRRWQYRLVKEGKITVDECNDRIAKRAEMLEL